MKDSGGKNNKQNSNFQTLKIEIGIKHYLTL